jgi:Protein of unknown function (DUF4242)
VPLFIVERHVPGITMAELVAAQQAAVAASAPASAARGIRYMRSTFIAPESRCICLFEAPNAEILRELNEAAHLPFVRIVEAVDLTP